MAGHLTSEATFTPPAELLWIDSIPILYEDEEEGDMGESNPHVLADEILHVCMKVHMVHYHPEYQVFSNMNLYYREGPPHPRTGSLPYVSPDSMVVKPYQLLDERVKSYTIGQDGPSPLLTAEVLSERSGQQRDLKEKTVVYARLAVPEYILVDESGKYMSDRLLLKRLQKDGTYEDEKDADGGVTSKLGFRIVIDADGLRVIDQATGHRYIRPLEAEAEALARRRAEQQLQSAQERIRALEQELARLQRPQP